MADIQETDRFVLASFMSHGGAVAINVKTFTAEQMIKALETLRAAGIAPMDIGGCACHQPTPEITSPIEIPTDEDIHKLLDDGENPTA